MHKEYNGATLHVGCSINSLPQVPLQQKLVTWLHRRSIHIHTYSGTGTIESGPLYHRYYRLMYTRCPLKRG